MKIWTTANLILPLYKDTSYYLTVTDFPWSVHRKKYMQMPKWTQAVGSTSEIHHK